MLSGQHITEAVRRRADDYRRELRDVPYELLHVYATVYKPDTPKAVRQLAAGEGQAVQTTTDELTYAQFAALILASSDVKDKRKRLGTAWLKAGWNRTTPLV